MMFVVDCQQLLYLFAAEFLVVVHNLVVVAVAVADVVDLIPHMQPSVPLDRLTLLVAVVQLNQELCSDSRMVVLVALLMLNDYYYDYDDLFKSIYQAHRDYSSASLLVAHTVAADGIPV
jgi:hypothetical protein